MFPGGTFRTGCAASVIYQVRTLFWHLKFTKKGLRARSRKQRKEEMSRYEVSFFLSLRIEPRLRGSNSSRQTISFGLTEDETGGVNKVTNGGRGQNCPQ